MKKTILFFALALSMHTVDAQYYQQCSKLTDVGSPANAFFGWSVGLSADATTAIVGTPGVSGAPGGAIIYNRSGSAWTQGATLTGTGVADANMGQSVAISADGSTAIVGCPGDNSNLGAVCIFIRSGSSWVQQGDKLVGSGATGAAFEGYSVSISGDGNTVIFGAPSDNATSSGEGVGAAWIFVRSGGVWTQQGGKIVGSGAAAYGNYQGFSVAMSADGNTAIIGGYADNAGSGAAWVFVKASGEWEQQGAKLTSYSFTGSIYDRFGTSVALSADGNTATIGAAYDNGGTGAAFVFTRAAGSSTWNPQAKLVGSFPVGNAQQGGSIAISAGGDTIAVGGGANIFTAGAGDIGVGAVWVWALTPSGWSQVGSKLVGVGNSGNSQQGSAVAITADGQTIITGGFGDNSDAGAVWVFSSTIPPNFTYVSSIAANTPANIYPNPATDELTIDFKTAIHEKTTIMIIDLLGRTITTGTVDGAASTYSENVSSLSPGTYILRTNSIAQGEQKFMFVKK